MRIAYRGNAYSGFQLQPDMPTVAGTLRGAIEAVVESPVRLRASSRTDAGVHALDLPVAFETSSAIPLRGMVLGTNTHLPTDIRVLRAMRFKEPIVPRLCSQGKLYRYLFWDGPVCSPLLAGLCTQVRRPLDVSRLAPALATLLGRHDFTAFRAHGCQATHAVRSIFLARAVRHQMSPHLVCLDIAGNAFVRHQIRILAGTLLEVAQGQRSTESFAELLAPGQREDAGRTLPASGLHLLRVRMKLPAPLDAWPPQRSDPMALFPM